MLEGAMLVLSVANALATESSDTSAICSKRCKSLEFIVRFLSYFFLATRFCERQKPEAFRSYGAAEWKSRQPSVKGLSSDRHA
jgi:hypothetical protein